jgi:branched-chain amino acid transport system substrate-binding protein
MGSDTARMSLWDGTKWTMTSDYIAADSQIIKPMIKAGADRYLAEKKLTRRTAADCET